MRHQINTTGNMSSHLLQGATELNIAEDQSGDGDLGQHCGRERMFELSEAQKQELDRRLDSYRADPSRGRTWEEI